MGLQLAPLATAWWVNSNYLARDDCGTKATNWASIEKPIYSFTWPSPYNSLSFLVPIGLKAEAARMAMAHGTLPAASVPIHTNLAPLTWAMTIHSVLPLFMLIFLKYRLDFRNYISKRKKKKNSDSTRIICSEILYHDFFTGQFYQIFRKYKTWNALDFMVYLLLLQCAYLVALGTSIFCKQSYFSCYCHVVFLCIKTIFFFSNRLKIY